MTQHDDFTGLIGVITGEARGIGLATVHRTCSTTLDMLAAARAGMDPQWPPARRERSRQI